MTMDKIQKQVKEYIMIKIDKLRNNNHLDIGFDNDYDFYKLKKFNNEYIMFKSSNFKFFGMESEIVFKTKDVNEVKKFIKEFIILAIIKFKPRILCCCGCTNEKLCDCDGEWGC